MNVWYVNKMNKRTLLDSPPIYKPFGYPWAYEAWLLQQRLHWLPEEISLNDDIKDWKNVLNEKEINLLTQIFRFFVQAEIEVNNCYMRHYSSVFKPTEVSMMLTTFSAMETIHTAAYSYLLDTVGMPESEYQAFLKYEEMKAKYDYMQEFDCSSKRDITKTLAAFGAFTEGLQLFAIFAILLNFQRFGKMRGMCQIVSFIARDETLHTFSLARLLNTFTAENPEAWDGKMHDEIYDICKTIVKHEDAFIDLAFEMGGVDGLSAEEVKSYIRFIANRRLEQIRLKPIYPDSGNPLPWMDNILNGMEHANFFENRPTEYSRAATEGSWEDAF